MEGSVHLAPNGEAINALLVQSLAQSTIGEAISKTIEKAIDDLDSTSGYGKKSMLQAALEGVIRDEVVRIARDDMRDVIEAKVREMLTDEKIHELVGSFVAELSLTSSRF